MSVSAIDVALKKQTIQQKKRIKTEYHKTTREEAANKSKFLTTALGPAIHIPPEEKVIHIFFSKKKKTRAL